MNGNGHTCNLLDRREINRRIAEFVGWRDLEWRDASTHLGIEIPEGWYGKGQTGPGRVLSDYVDSVDDLIPVIEKLRRDEKYIDVSPIGQKSYAADVYDIRDKLLGEAMVEGVGRMAEAICLAIIDYLDKKEPIE